MIVKGEQNRQIDCRSSSRLKLLQHSPVLREVRTYRGFAALLCSISALLFPAVAVAALLMLFQPNLRGGCGVRRNESVKKWGGVYKIIFKPAHSLTRSLQNRINYLCLTQSLSHSVTQSPSREVQGLGGRVFHSRSLQMD